MQTRAQRQSKARQRGIENFRAYVLKEYLQYNNPANGDCDAYLLEYSVRKLLRQALEFNVDLDGCELLTPNYWKQVLAGYSTIEVLERLKTTTVYRAIAEQARKVGEEHTVRSSSHFIDLLHLR